MLNNRSLQVSAKQSPVLALQRKDAVGCSVAAAVPCGKSHGAVEVEVRADLGKRGISIISMLLIVL
jgi:hypothetical protein